MAEPRSLRDGLFTVHSDGSLHLIGGACAACGRHSFPALSTCPYCAAEFAERVELGTRGRLEVFTEVVNRPPGYDGPLPFRLGVIELSEGLSVISRVDSQISLAEGAAGAFVPESLGADPDGREVITFCFRTDEGPAVAPRLARAALSPPDFGAARPFARPVYLSGVGLHAFGRFDSLTLTDVGVSAVQSALRQTGCERGGFQAAFCASVYGGVAAGHKVLTSLGLTGLPIVNVEAGCASGGAALGLAASAIASGQYDRVLVFGMEKMPKGIIRSSFFEPWREQGGLAVTPAYFALRARRLMRDSGVTSDDLADVSVKNHRRGVANPYAMFRKELTREQVLGSAMVCDPLRLFMLCSPNEGAAAVVLSSRPTRDSVRVLATSLCSHLPGSVLGEHTPLGGLTGEEPTAPSERAANAAYEAAGIGPSDVDVVELQDTDSARELLSYEELGLCEKGGAGRWLREVRNAIVNPSGGLLSKGEPLGASGLAQVVELYWQLRGKSDARQIPGARRALAHTVGRGANASVVLLAK